jgi:GT2 family glycosyltransferase
MDMAQNTALSALANPLVITAALHCELPVDWLKAQHIPVLHGNRCEAWDTPQSGLIAVITGTGIDNAERSINAIVQQFSPRFVLNIGTVGHPTGQHPLGRFITPTRLCLSGQPDLLTDTRLPLDDSLLNTPRHIGGSLTSLAHIDPLADNDYVDMEAYPQARICAQHGVHFHLLKYISDHNNDFNKSTFKTHCRTLRSQLMAWFEKSLLAPDKNDIGVIIPLHNRADKIRACVQSVIDQTLPAREIIVVDDGSSDCPEHALSEFKHHVTLLRSPENRGVSHARNRGIRQAQSGWLCFLDSDDLWEPQKLQQQWQFHQHYPFYRISQTEDLWMRHGRRVNAKKIHQKPLGWVWEKSLERCLISPSAVMINKKLLEKTGAFDENLPACEDYDLWLKISRFCPVGLTAYPGVTRYGGHSDQLSQRFVAMDRFRVSALQHALQSEICPQHQSALRKQLQKKIAILIKGYHKHQNSDQASYYEQLLDQLNLRQDS